MYKKSIHTCTYSLSGDCFVSCYPVQTKAGNHFQSGNQLFFALKKYETIARKGIKNLHTSPKSVSAISLFKTEQSNATAIQILQGEKLKEHLTKVPALLICIEGEAIYEDEDGRKENLLTGDYVAIEPMVKHWV